MTNLTDLVHEVTQWHVETFGRQSMDEPLARKLVEEANEFCYDCDPFVPDHRIEEAADVLIVLCAWAGRNGVDLLAAAFEKLEHVKNRDQKQRDVERGILPKETIS